MILVSYPPFLHHTASGIKEKIIQGIYEFHPEYWGHISPEAKDFVSRLLTVDAELRMTAVEALLHPWVRTVGAISPTCCRSYHHYLVMMFEITTFVSRSSLSSQQIARYMHALILSSALCPRGKRRRSC